MYNFCMNDDVINDLKEFITTTVSQQTFGIDEQFEKVYENFEKLETRLETKLGGKIDDLSNSVAQALAATNDDTDAQLKDHEQRIFNLEQKTV